MASEWEEKDRTALERVRALLESALIDGGYGLLTAVWRLVTAMRGPDSGSAEAKGLTTTVRRRVMGRDVANALGVSQSQLFGVLPDNEAIVWSEGDQEAQWRAECHFRQHCEEGSRVVNRSLVAMRDRDAAKRQENSDG